MECVIEERMAGDAELTELLTAAFAELVGRYGAEGRSLVKAGARYFVVLDDEGRAVGCDAHAARSAGYPVLRLSTGQLQPEAIALYESGGYVRTAPWDKYVDQPGVRCYAKSL
ncbi:hypothetical protein [Kribbella sp. HUAS MG21]|uniref:Uncharacterized protein n=1 Tax=Kribbella sp. HUAS MG21 TaxID=3160966 RepID=A0AAU7TH20_9ACTN